MDYFEDFEPDNEIIPNFSSLRDEPEYEYAENIQLKHKSKNKFVFQSFSSRLQNLKFRLNQNIDKDYNLLTLNNENEELLQKKKMLRKDLNTDMNIDIEGEEELNLISSNFKILLEREKSINSKNSEFLNLYNKLNIYSFSYIYLVHNYKKIFDIIKEEIKQRYENKNIDGLIICFDLMIALIKDIREECYDYFIENNLEQIVKLIKIDSNEIDDNVKYNLIDQIFTFFTNIFKFFEKTIQKNFKKLFIIYSELLFNSNKYIRLFASQSLCYIIKNLSKEEINDTFDFLFDIMLQPNKLFESSSNNMDIDVENNLLEKENISSKMLIYNILEKNGNDSGVKILIADSISELLTEVLLNIKTISIKADLILEKFNDLSEDKKCDININIIFVQTFIKLIKKINSKFILDAIALFHFFILNFFFSDTKNNNKKTDLPNYQKMKSLKLKEQLNKIKNIFISNKDKKELNILYTITSFLIFSKELLLKNFKDTSRTFSDYINDLITEFQDFIFISEQNFIDSDKKEINLIQKILLIEISCLLSKFHSNVNIEYPLCQLIIDDNKLLNYFLYNLIELNSFAFFQSFSLYSFRLSQAKVDNDEYNIIEYNKDKIEEIFNKIINNENIQFNTLLNIIDTDEKLFKENLGLVIYEEKQKDILINYIFNHSKKDIANQIENLNEKNFSEIKKLIFICKMINNEKTTKYIQENIVEEICKLFKEKKNKMFNEQNKYENIFGNDFYYKSKHYINKTQCLLEMISSCYKSCNEKSIELIKELLIENKIYLNYYGIYYSLLNSIFFNSQKKINEDNNSNINILDLNLSNYSVNLLSSHNTFKYQFAILFQNYLIKKYSNEFKPAEITLINDIFSSIESLLQGNINLTYDKKYSITLEIIVSKLELILSKEGINKYKLELLSFIFWFLLGCYWISLTKSVWPVLGKMLSQIFTFLIESINIMKYPEYKRDIIDYIMNPINEVINYIQEYPSEYDFVNKNNELIKNNYIIIEEQEEKNINKNINILSDEYKTTSTFFTGMPNGLIDSYCILLNSDDDFRNNFIENIFINTSSKFDTDGYLLIKEIYNNKILNDDYNVLFNYIYDKENKTSFNSTIFKLKESLFGIMSKLENLAGYPNYEKIKKIIYAQIILSRSTLIQKYSIDILAIFDTHIKNYTNLLKEIVDNTNVLMKVNNLEKIMSDNNQLITEEDRKYLMPIMTRLYYSKYFNIKNTEFSANTKKLKTKNKINLINYFVQLNPHEFSEYINIIFESINKELFNMEKFQKKIDYKTCKYNYALLNIRTMKKILEIVKLNLKQITKLFNDDNIIENISNLLINCFVFFKNLGHKIKKNKDEIYQNCIKYIENYSTNKIHNYFNAEEFDKFFSFMSKNIKDLKREFFSIFIMLFNQFYSNETLVKNLSQRLCDEYENNLLNKVANTSNSIYKFFLSLSRHSKLHFIFIINNNLILKALFNSLQSEDIERNFILKILDFFENIISPYSIETLNQSMEGDNQVNNSTIKSETKKQSEYVEIMELDDDISSDEESLNNIKDDIPLTDEELIHNFNNIIIKNFNEINKSLTCLIFHEKISPTIKDNLTRKIIEILLNIWSLYINTNTTKQEKKYEEIPSIEELFNFIMTIIQKDKKILSEKEIFDSVLKLLHILIVIKIKKNEDKKNLNKIYDILINLIYKINNFNSRLLLSIILREFSVLEQDNEKNMNNFIEVLEILIQLNTNKTGKREMGKELDDDFIIDLINNKLNRNFIEKNISYMTVIIYQLLVLSSNANIDDFALNSSSLEKLKEIFIYISEENIHNKFTEVFNTFFYLLKNDFVIYSKILYEIFYTVNSINQSDITGKDIFNIKFQEIEEDNIDIDLINNSKKNNDEFNFFLDIMNFNIDRRVQALKMLEINLSSNEKISEISIINFIIPVIENFLNYKYYIELPSNDKNKKKNFIIKHKNESLKEIISYTQKILPLIIEYPMQENITKRILLFLYSNLKKISKNNNQENDSNDFIYTVDIFKMTNESLTIALNSIIKVYFNKIDYNTKMEKLSKQNIDELNQKVSDKDNNINNNKTKEDNNDHNNNINPKDRNKKIDVDSLYKNNIYVLISNMYNNFFKQLNDEIVPELDKLKTDENTIMHNTEEINNEKIDNLFSMNLYEILISEIYPTLKSLLYIDEYRENKNNYYIRNYIIIPYIHLIKLIPPMKTRSELNQLIIELINNLSSMDAGLRSKSRDGMKFFITNLDQIFLLKFFESMKSSFKSGYQRHIFAYTVNYLLQFMSNYKICEISLELIMPILFDELFGDIKEEKEIGNLVNKYKESKENKGLNSMELIGKNISIRFLVNELITPMKNYLMKRKNCPEMTQKVNEVIIAIVKGIKNNQLIVKENHEIINDLLDYGFILVDFGVEKNMQNLKEIKKLKNIEIKGGDIYTIDFKNLDNPYVIEVANTFIEEKNEIIYSNLFAVLGLEFFSVLLKNKIFEFSKIEKDSELYEKLNKFLETIFRCIKMTNNTVVVSKSIKIIISMITENEKFFVIKKNLNKITKNLFKLILSIGNNDIPLAQSVLSAISAILTKFNFITVTDSQIKTLLSFLKLNIFSPEIKPYIFSCFYSLIKRKILHPDIYDMIDYLRDVYLKSFDENTITLCKKIFFEFINTYPLEIKGRLNHLNFFINNCENGLRKSELNSIDMLINFSEKKNFEGIKENIDFIIMKMFTLYANSEDSELKVKIEELILNLYQNYCDKNNNCFKVYYEKALNIIENSDNKNTDNINIFGIIVISLLLNIKVDFIDINKIIKALNANIKKEISLMNEYIQNKMNNYDYLLMSNNNKVKLNQNTKDENNKENNDRWNILYQILSCIERLFNNYILIANSEYKIQKNNLNNIINLFDNIIQTCTHPHTFIKVIALRLILNIVLSYDEIFKLNESQLSIILSQINFILVSNPDALFFEEKAFDYCRNIIKIIVVKKEFKENEKILEFFKNLTREVKKWISNKSNGLIILNRVIDLYDDVIEKFFYEEKNEECYYLKPIIELTYRINNNQLAENVIKQRCGTILEKISKKMNNKKLSEVYKEVTKDINFLKQKRKMEQVDKFRKSNEDKNKIDKIKNKMKNKKHQNKKKNKNMNLNEDDED